MANSDNRKTNVALSSVLAGLTLTAGKFVVGIMTGSMGILSEAAHSLLDMGAAIITYFAVCVSDKPADEEHHFGHGKIEAFSALIETILLFITSVWIIYEASKRLISGNIEVEATWYTFAVVIISILIDFTRSRALMRVAKETGSQALEADALHFQTDIWSSAVVLVGLFCVRFGIKGADSIAALFVALIVIKVGWNMGRRTFDVLIDTAPAGIAEKHFQRHVVADVCARFPFSFRSPIVKHLPDIFFRDLFNLRYVHLSAIRVYNFPIPIYRRL